MKRIAALVVAGALAVAAAPARAPEVDADHTIELGIGDTANVEGTAQGGMNLSGYVDGTVTCTDSPEQLCETIFVAATNEVPEGETIASGVVSVALNAQVPGADFDLYVFESDETGAKGAEVASSGDAAAGQIVGSDPAGLLYTCTDAVDECLQFVVDTFDDEPTRYYLVEVVYFASAGSYSLDASFS